MVKKIFRSVVGMILTLVLVLSPLSSAVFADTVHITGTVTDQNGAPLSNVAVLARNPGGTTQESTTVGTAADGTYDLPVQPGTYDILFGPPSSTSAYGPAIVRNVSVQNSQTINAQLTDVQHTFSGTVVDSNGSPIPNLQVRIGSSLSGQSYRAFTTATGAYAITAPAGYYDYTNFGGLTDPITLEGYPLASPSIGGLGGANSLTVDTTDADITQNFTLNFVKLTIAVKDSLGNPVAGQYVHTRYGSGLTPVNSGSTTYSLPNNGNNYGDFTGSDGTYTAWVSKGAVYPAGTICLDSSVNLQSCDVASNTVKVSASGDINLLFQGNPPTQVVSLSAPTGLSGASPTNQPPALTWNAVDNADHYEIYRDGSDIGSTTSTNYTDSTASQGSHSYYVVAVAENGTTSDPSSAVAVVYDATAPTISYSVSPAADSFGWWNSNVTVTFNCNDALSGIQLCSPPVLFSTEGSRRTVSGTAIDNAGNTASITTAVLKLDKTAPTITSSINIQPTAYGWYDGSALVSFQCSDALSGIASCSNPVAPNEGQNQVVTGTAVDQANNSSTATSAPLNVDKTPPTIVASVNPAPNANGWNKNNVTVSFACADALSGVASCSSPVTVSTEGANQVVTGTATDKAGNTTTITKTIKLDKTAPTVSSPTMSNTFIINSANETLSANASDALSGVVGGEYYIDTDPGQGLGSAMTYTNGKLTATKTISGLSIGQHKLYMRSKDAAGNWSTPVSVTFIFI